MPSPLQRREHSSTPDYSSKRASSPSRDGPAWKGKAHKRRFLDARQISQLVAGVTILFLLIALYRHFTPNTDLEYQQFTNERSPAYNSFVEYEGGLDCGLKSQDLYAGPQWPDPLNPSSQSPYCKNRVTLLDAMSGGGRHGFDQPFVPNGCHYKWYTTKEICMILDRFDGVAFVGDGMIAQIYAAFNILLRRNLAVGALEQWRMTDKELDHCRCNNQFTKLECAQYYVQKSGNVVEFDHESGLPSPYICNRAPHFFYSINGPAPTEYLTGFHEFLDQNPTSWKPVPIIHSLGLSREFDWQVATDSMDEWLTVADASGRNTPFLWIGPNAAGHLKLPHKIMQEGNNALWYYSLLMQKEAQRRGCESLEMYNMTLQASSWDGSNYGNRVALAQAMMVINWLARIDAT